MIRTADTLVPTGEQVQISKNWHDFSTTSSDKNYAAEKANVRIYNKQWYHGYTAIEAPAEDYTQREYTCAYGNWGGVYAASHAQLCLIGWGGNQLWDQSALGSWGESVTYDPDICLSRSMVDDVRPFLVRSPEGNNQAYNWTGNVGGADFLNYSELGEQRIINQKITYKTQAPNMTNVVYSGVTANGKIATHVIPEKDVPPQPYEQPDLFEDQEAADAGRQQEKELLAKERRLQQALLKIKKKYGKNAVLKAMNLHEGATARERNQQVGGHKK